jgi:hypothetical protein
MVKFGNRVRLPWTTLTEIPLQLQVFVASLLGTPRTIAQIELKGIQLARKGIANVKASFCIEKNQSAVN